MKEFNVVYKYGHVYEADTRKRLIITDGAKIKMTIDESLLQEADPNLIETKPLNAVEKAEELREWCTKASRKQKQYAKVYAAGTELYFEITAGVRKQDNDTQYYKVTFKLKLLEDLYVYKFLQEEIKYGRFFDCRCVVVDSFPKLEYFEHVPGISLNDAYTKTYELYFAMFGKSTVNVFDRVFEDSGLNIAIRGTAELALKNSTL